MLVYLGGETETETEDLLDTERSFDYQDQAFRQTSICDAASLAPTLDGSISELLFASPIEPIEAGNSRRDLDQHFLSSCEPPTPTNIPQTQQQFFPQNKTTKKKGDNSRSEQESVQATPLEIGNIVDKETRAQEEELDMIYAQKQQLNARRHLPTNPNKSPTNSSPSPKPRLESSMFSANDAAELDRLLAEMSHSLDLDSLARFDSGASRQSELGSQQQQAPSKRDSGRLQQTASDRKTFQREHQEERSKSREKASTLGSATTSNKRAHNATHANHSNESILDDYDDASRILERMISDAQMATSYNQKTTSLAKKVLQPPKLTRPQKPPAPTPESMRNYEPKLVQGIIMKARPVATCREATRNELQPEWASDLPNKRVVPAPSDQARQSHTLSDRSGSVDSRRAWQERKLRILSQSTEEEAEAGVGGDKPPELPMKDYPQQSNWHEDTQNVIEAKANEFEEDQRDLRPGKAQLAWMKRRTMSSMRSMRSKLSDFMAHSGDAWAHHNSNTNQQTRVKQAAAKFESNTLKGQAKERQSRSHSRNLNKKPLEPLSEQLSNLGEEIRKRLSRSKSRLGQIFSSTKSNQSRAKSMPNDKTIGSSSPSGQLATISDVTGVACAVQEATHERESSSSSCSLSGLEKTSPSPLAKIASSTSIKRLSGLKMMPTGNFNSTFDEQEDGPQRPVRRTKHRSRRRKGQNKGHLIDNTTDLMIDKAQQGSLEVGASSENKDYFLQKLASSSSPTSKSEAEEECSSEELNKSKSSQCLNSSPKSKTLTSDQSGHLKKKSQSLRCLKPDKMSQVSRRLPESGNSFRPASVARMLTSPTSEIPLAHDDNAKATGRKSRSTITRSALSNYKTPIAAASSPRSSSSQSSSGSQAPKAPPRSRQRAKSMHAPDHHKTDHEPALKSSKSRLSILAGQLKQMGPFKTSAGKLTNEPSRLPAPNGRRSRRDQHDNKPQSTNKSNDSDSLCHWSPVIKNPNPNINNNNNNSNIPTWFQKGKMLSEL